MKVWKYGNTLVVTFAYHPRLLNVIREVDGRIFNRDKKRWEVPGTSVIQCVDLLKEAGFQITDDVWQAYDEAKKLKEIAHEIRSNSPNLGPYTGSLPLYDFQKLGTAFIRFLPASLLADAPGLGKTLQTAAAFEDMPGPILVLVPASLKFNWQEELFKWVPQEKCHVIHGVKQKRMDQWAQTDLHKWTIANYELLLRDFDFINATMWQAIVCDEADRIANPFAKTVKLLKQIRCGKKVALTGTPVSNTPEDLWSICDWMQPRMLGTFKQFREKYCVMDSRYQGKIIGYRNLDQLREAAAGVMLRRQKEDVLKDFPAKTVEHIRFDLGKEEREAYDGLRKMIKEELAKLPELDQKTLNILPVRMLRLKQATGDLRLLDEAAGERAASTKLQTLYDMLRPIAASGEKAIVFTQFAEMAKLLKTALADFNPLLIYGGVEAKERQRLVNAFRDEEIHQVMIMTEAGSVGLNLQAASYVFHYDAPWSVAKIEQREGRAHRVGQDKPVTVYHLIARNTIDEYVLKVLAKKREMSEQILGDGREAHAERQLTLAEAEEILEG